MTETAPRKIVIVGHVDHGKSTLLGRLLMDFGRVPEETIEKVRKICAGRGVALEPAFFLDAFQEEQEQGISIDTTRVNFEFEDRRFLLIDAPGHLEFLKNMTTGASGAEHGIMVIDAFEGIGSQTLRHLKILGILGISKVIVVVNKMDKLDYDQTKYEELAAAVREMVEREEQNLLAIVPISALKGENVVNASDKLEWYRGLPLLPLLVSETDRLSVAKNDKLDAPFRMILQDVYRFTDERLFAGRVLSGTIEPGKQVFFSPSGKVSTVLAIDSYPDGPLASAKPGDSVALKLREQIFVERGEIVCSPGELPEVNNEIEARLVWLNSEALDEMRDYILKVGTAEVPCRLRVISESTTDGGNGIPSGKPQAFTNGHFVDVVIKAARPVAFDSTLAQGVNKIVICTTFETVAAGAVKSVRAAKTAHKTSPNIVVETGFVQRWEHEQRQTHKGTVLWMTGLSGAGKTSLAKALERRLFSEGCRVVVLDGDNLRSGVCADLGFGPEDRSENIRRVAHMAKLFLSSGAIVITACISPYEKDRQMAREIIGEDDFNELFIFCPIEVCQERDPKGLYKKATGGQIKDFSGLNSPYQPPAKPKLRLDSSITDIDSEVDEVVKLLAREGVTRKSLFSPMSRGLVIVEG